MAVFLLCSTFHNILYLPIFSSLHNPPSPPNPLRKKIFYPFPLRRIYLPFTKSEGKSASWRSRVCDEDLSKYNRLIIISKPEKYTTSGGFSLPSGKVCDSKIPEEF